MSILSPVTEILLPNADGTVNNWSPSTGSDIWALLDDYDPTSPSNTYATTTTLAANFIVGFPSLSVTSSDIVGGTLHSVAAYAYLYVNGGRHDSCDIRQILNWNDDGSVSQVGYINHLNVISKWQGEPRLIYSENDADPSKVNDYEVETVYLTQSSSGLEVRVEHIWLEVKYTLKVNTYDDQFNRIIVTQGTSELTSGTIVI